MLLGNCNLKYILFIECQEYALKRGELCPISVAPLIIGGKKSDDKEFPHMALIGYNMSQNDFFYSCGGSLISDRFILSAAHCAFSGQQREATFAKLGYVKRGVDNPNTLLVHIAKRFKHPHYKSGILDNDIALFKLKETVQFNEYIRPICLPHLNEETYRAVVTGWGHVEYGGDLSTDLLKVTLDIFNQTDCQSKYSSLTDKASNGVDYETKICAGSYNDNLDSCTGDSGN